MSTEAQEIHFSLHALQRYRDRSRPDLALAELPAHLQALAPTAQFHLDPPPYGHWREVPGRAFLTIEHTTFALEVDRWRPSRLIAVTCLKRRGRQPALRTRVEPPSEH
jgi:hypothetical protein